MTELYASTHTCMSVCVYYNVCAWVYLGETHRRVYALLTSCLSSMLSNLLRLLQLKFSDVPLDFYSDCTVLCNRLTAQCLSYAHSFSSQYIFCLSYHTKLDLYFPPSLATKRLHSQSGIIELLVVVVSLLTKKSALWHLRNLGHFNPFNCPAL